MHRIVRFIAGLAVIAAVATVGFRLWVSSQDTAPVQFPFTGTLDEKAPILTQDTCRAVFAVIGDYGQAGPREEAVVNLVKAWQPDFITTTGDNNYPDGEAETIDANVGQYFHEYIHPYKGTYGEGAQVNRFFPSLGNHDWHTAGAKPYLDYFELPGNERYYETAWGPVHLFVLDSSSTEPDGISVSSKQAQWLKGALAASQAPWKLVVLHHAPYSSGSNHGSNATLQWPYEEWGADAVLAGHDHIYERLAVNGIPYFVNGVGGGALYGFGRPLPQSQAHHVLEYGAMRVEATPERITYSFVTVDGEIEDTHTVENDRPGTCAPIPS